jgi:hypothetical protein
MQVKLETKIVIVRESACVIRTVVEVCSVRVHIRWYATDDGAIDTGAIDNGTIHDSANNIGAVDTGAIDKGAIEDGTIDEGAIDEGAIEDGAVEDGTIDTGAVEDGAIDTGAIDTGVNDGNAVQVGRSVAQGIISRVSPQNYGGVLLVLENIIHHRITICP